MYFSNFPNIVYDFNINGVTEYKVIKDITRNVRLRKTILENIALFDEYDIGDGETAEIISEKVYGTPMYHWVIMLVNQKYDYINDFPLTNRELEAHIDDIYGDKREHAHHYNYIDTLTNKTYQKEVSVTLQLTNTIGTIAVSDIVTSTGFGYQARVDEIVVPRNDLGEMTIKISMRSGNFFTGTETLTTASGRDVNITSISYAENYSIVTNAQYEDQLNETKRRIKVVDPRYIEQLLKEFEDIL